ncbi:MAG: ATP-binding protein [Bacteroidetes bacterium]|nr:ATP-binding protein [Bacteroidota bacterium]
MEVSVKISSDLHNLKVVEEFIEQTGRMFGIGRETYGKVLVSVMEAANNAITHGNRGASSKAVEICFRKSDTVLEIIVIDEGEGFSHETVPDPTMPENRENIRGRGVFLMKRLSDKLEYNKKGNMVTMFFSLSET